jgi:hypothetical protein
MKKNMPGFAEESYLLCMACNKVDIEQADQQPRRARLKFNNGASVAMLSNREISLKPNQMNSGTSHYKSPDRKIKNCTPLLEVKACGVWLKPVTAQTQTFGRRAQSPYNEGLLLW